MKKILIFFEIPDNLENKITLYITIISKLIYIQNEKYI